MLSLSGCSEGAKGTGSPPAPGIGPILRARPGVSLCSRPRDPELGLIQIRLTTWFPFNIQIYVNGHSWLAQQMLQQRLGFSQQDNAFTALDDPPPMRLRNWPIRSSTKTALR